MVTDAVCISSTAILVLLFFSHVSSIHWSACVGEVVPQNSEDLTQLQRDDVVVSGTTQPPAAYLTL